MFDHFSAKNNKLRRMGSSILMKYHTIYVAWNAFLRLMGINYPQCFSCPICRDSPETVILDGVTLGTMKELPPERLQTDNTISLLSTTQLGFVCYFLSN